MLAYRLAGRAGRPVIYCATATIDGDDAEWMARIERHRAERPREWVLVETAVPEEKDLIQALADARESQIVIVDSLGCWLADVMSRHPCGPDVVEWQSELEQRMMSLLNALERCAAEVIVVSEEVGWGIVPMHASGRVFRDVMGRAGQRLCAHAEHAYLVVSGVAIDLKNASCEP